MVNFYTIINQIVLKYIHTEQQELNFYLIINLVLTTDLDLLYLHNRYMGVRGSPGPQSIVYSAF